MKTAFYSKSERDELGGSNSATVVSAHGGRTDNVRSRTELPATEHDIARSKLEHVLHDALQPIEFLSKSPSSIIGATEMRVASVAALLGILESPMAHDQVFEPMVHTYCTRSGVV